MTITPNLLKVLLLWQYSIKENWLTFTFMKKKITIGIHIQLSRDPCILLQIWQKIFSRKIKLSICWIVKNNSTPMNWNTEGCGKSNLKSIKIATFLDQKQFYSSVISRETWWRRSRLKLHIWNSDWLYYLEKKNKKGTWFWPLF